MTQPNLYKNNYFEKILARGVMKLYERASRQVWLGFGCEPMKSNRSMVKYGPKQDLTTPRAMSAWSTILSIGRQPSRSHFFNIINFSNRIKPLLKWMREFKPIQNLSLFKVTKSNLPFGSKIKRIFLFSSK